jgi:hypothetical protein
MDTERGGTDLLAFHSLMAPFMQQKKGVPALDSEHAYGYTYRRSDALAITCEGHLRGCSGFAIG